MLALTIPSEYQISHMQFLIILASSQELKLIISFFDR
jgi:hypothetical protein